MVDSSYKTTNKNSGEVPSVQANSFINSGASTGAQTKSGGKPPTNQYISIPSDKSSHGSGFLIKEELFDQLP